MSDYELPPPDGLWHCMEPGCGFVSENDISAEMHEETMGHGLIRGRIAHVGPFGVRFDN